MKILWCKSSHGVRSYVYVHAYVYVSNLRKLPIEQSVPSKRNYSLCARQLSIATIDTRCVCVLQSQLGAGAGVGAGVGAAGAPGPGAAAGGGGTARAAPVGDAGGGVQKQQQQQPPPGRATSTTHAPGITRRPFVVGFSYFISPRLLFENAILVHSLPADRLSTIVQCCNKVDCTMLSYIVIAIQIFYFS